MNKAVHCGNCDKVFDLTSEDILPLNQVLHLGERLEPGDDVPYGECKDCGTFVYVFHRGL